MHGLLRLFVGVGDVHEMPVLDVVCGRCPAGLGGGTAIVPDVLRALLRGEVGEAEIEAVLPGEDRAVLAVARDQDAGMRVLNPARPYGDVPEAIEPALPAERLRFGEAR